MWLPVNFKSINYHFSCQPFILSVHRTLSNILYVVLTQSFSSYVREHMVVELNEAFLKGALLNYCKCCVWIRSHSRRR